jgi:Tol biopolymer transport system component
MKICLPFLICVCYSLSLCAQGLPGTEIYLFDVAKRNGIVVLSNPKNITNHPGYDNQPFFHPEKSLIYFSSGNDEGRTDIFEYDYNSGAARQITNTSEREYSPTVTPDLNFVSCIIQRDSGAQDLGKYPLEGGTPKIIINSLVVGYHVWADENNIFVFALGEKNTLRHWSVSNRKDKIIQENIGRSLHRIPGTSSISFVDKTSPDGKWVIKKVRANGEKSEILANTLPNREDLCWTSDGNVIMSDGEKFFITHPGKVNSWELIENNSGIVLKNISRISINSTSTKLAVVVSE